MSIETWGDMNKSQIDSELIESAISRLIQAHDDDPEAHLDAGQSLTTHRAAEILDHPASSVVPDKASSDFVVYENMFNSPTAYSESGTVSQSGSGGIVLNTSSAGDTFSEVQIPWPFFNDDLSSGHDVVCDFISQIIHAGATYAGQYMFGGDDDGFGFRWSASGIQGFLNIRGVQTNTGFVALISGQVYAFRIFISAVDGLAHFIINGTEIGAIAFTGDFGGIDTTVYIYSSCGATSSTQVSFGMLHLSFKMY